MGPSASKWMSDAAVRICVCLSRGDGQLSISQAMREVARRQGWMDRHEEALAVRGSSSAASLMRAKPRGMAWPAWVALPMNMRHLEKVANEIDRHAQLRIKSMRVGMLLDRGRKDGQAFYMVSRHQRPAKGHKGMQGAIVVDRYWRQSLRDAGRADAIPKVEAYVRNHGTITVQEAMRGPYWIVTRPYCRHRFVPVPTDEVLTSSARAVERRHPETMDHAHRSMTPKERYDAYKARRARIRERCERRMSE